MKVLLVSGGDLPESFDRFVSAFRHKIGTCEHLHLLRKQSSAEQKVHFEQHRHSMSFDRFVMCYQNYEWLNNLVELSTDLEQQTFLSLHQEQSAERGVVAKYARANPWMRWTGSDQTSFDYYKRMGMDAYLLSPMSMVIARAQPSSPRRKFSCHILGYSEQTCRIALPPEPSYCRYAYVDSNIFQYTQEQIKPSDVVLLSTQVLFERHLIADIIAQGAAVVVPTSEVSIRTADGFMRRACVMIDTSAELESLFEQIHFGENIEFLHQIFSQARYCSPEAVAIQLEQILNHAGRSRSAYIKRSSWL